MNLTTRLKVLKRFCKRLFKCDVCGQRRTVSHLRWIKRYDVDRRTIIDVCECDVCRMLREQL